MSYQETIAYLFGLQKHGVKLGLANSLALLAGMENPHLRFPSIHIAGTNGKGSTAAFLSTVLQTAGYRVGLYTSPHLIDFTERIRVNGVPVTEARVVELAERVRNASLRLTAQDGSTVIPTFFEVTTTMAFSCFAEERVDIAVVEAGMGGRLDATNVIVPRVTVITNIDVEHTEFLGTTIPQIAAEKAGIIKPEVPVVTGAVQPEAVAVIEREAARKGAPVFRLMKDFDFRRVFSGRQLHFDYSGITRGFDDLSIGMRGRHQVMNACIALAGLECVAERGFPVQEPELRAGLAAAAWEGRLERLRERPDLYLDGAHNPSSAQALAKALAELKGEQQRMVLVLGLLRDKDLSGIIEPLAPLADRVIVTQPSYSRAANSYTLAALVRRLHHDVSVTASVEDAVQMALREAAAEDLIVVTGSLFTVGDARALLTGGDGAGMTRRLQG